MFDEHYYKSSPIKDPKGPDSGFSSRVLRGGAWNDVGQMLRSAVRSLGAPNDGDNKIGFRVVRP